MAKYSATLLSGVPSGVARLVVKAALDEAQSQGSIAVLAYFAVNATASGDILAGTGPADVAKVLGVSKATVFRALALLEETGYIAWDRAVGYEKALGVTGRVRIRVPEALR